MKVSIAILKLIIVLFFISGSLLGQETSVGDSTKTTNDTDTLFNTESKTFMLIPIVNNSPSLGLGAGLVGMYFFKFNKKDTISPPNLLNIYSLYTNRQSYMLFTNGKFFWKNDLNRLEMGYGNIEINHDNIYSQPNQEDLKLVYTENKNMFFLQYSRNLIESFYLGIFYFGSQTNYSFTKGTDEENEQTEQFFKDNGFNNNFISSIGLNFQWDNRDYIYNPTKGLYASVRPKYFGEWLGSNNNYVDTDYKFTYFKRLDRSKILAAAVAGGIAVGDVPFDGYQSYGLRNSLRGYPTGKYKGPFMIATQLELRWNVYKRWGTVFFAGTGRVAGNESEDALDRTWLPSAGAGLRFMASRVKRINVRLDVAYGVDGNNGIYFGIMEAF